jgi:hypothetical protein
LSTAADTPARVARLLALAIAVAGTVMLLIGVAGHKPKPLNASTLVSSLEDEAGSAALPDGHCGLDAPDRWSCTIADHEGSGGATYTVRRTSGRCWSARLLDHPGGGESAMPRAAHGCITG